MKRLSVLALAGSGLLLAAGSIAGPEKFASEGVIVNEDGEKCAYRQEVISGATHFHGDSIATTNGELVFNDARCMDDTDGNKTRINDLISTWYSHPDADFDTGTLHNSSLHQQVGRCMQSRSYAAIGVVLDYVVSEGSIVKVVHGPALEGCLVRALPREPDRGAHA